MTVLLINTLHLTFFLCYLVNSIKIFCLLRETLHILYAHRLSTIFFKTSYTSRARSNFKNPLWHFCRQYLKCHGWFLESSCEAFRGVYELFDFAWIKVLFCGLYYDIITYVRGRKYSSKINPLIYIILTSSSRILIKLELIS